MAKFRKQVEGYEILDPVGNPQESRVFQGRHVETDRTVAIKALPLDFFQSEKELTAFRELTAKAAALKHPNVLFPEKVIGKYTEAYLVEEYIDGPNIKIFVNNTPPDIPLGNRMTYQLLNAVQFLHGKKLIHRNIKATNVLVRPDKSVTLCDAFYSPLFVRWRKQKGFPSVESVRYVSPEECLEKKLTPQSDIYSLGVILFLIYTRVLPVRGTSVPELQQKHVKAPIREKPDMINPSLPPETSKMILKMLNKAPKKRYAELSELILDYRRKDGVAPKAGIGRAGGGRI